MLFVQAKKLHMQLRGKAAAAAPRTNSTGRVKQGAAAGNRAAKVCGGCGAYYCSAACQAADRKRHKHACRRMMADGKKCI